MEGCTELCVTSNTSLSDVGILRLTARPHAAAAVLGFLMVHNIAQLHVDRMFGLDIDTTDWSSHSVDPNPNDRLRDVM